MPKIIIYDTIIFLTAISILVISNHNSLPVLFDKNCFRIFYLKTVFIFSHWKWPAQGTGTVPIASAHFRSLFVSRLSFYIMPQNFWCKINLRARNGCHCSKLSLEIIINRLKFANTCGFMQNECYEMLYTIRDAILTCARKPT